MCWISSSWLSTWVKESLSHNFLRAIEMPWLNLSLAQVETTYTAYTLGKPLIKYAIHFMYYMSEFVVCKDFHLSTNLFTTLMWIVSFILLNELE